MNSSSVFLACVYLVVGVSGYSTDYVTPSCSTTRKVVWSARIYQLRSYSWPIATSCSMVYSGNSFTSTEIQRLSFNFLSLNMPCQYGSLDLLDSTGNILRGGICGYSAPTFDSFDRTITIRLNRKSSLPSGSFRILVTRFNKDLFCNSGDFSCANGKCIDNILTCDGYNNCGDNSDEFDNGCFTWSTGIRVGIGISVFGFIMILLVIAAVFRRRRYGAVFYASPNCEGTSIVTSSHSSCSGGYNKF